MTKRLLAEQNDLDTGRLQGSLRAFDVRRREKPRVSGQEGTAKTRRLGKLAQTLDRTRTEDDFRLRDVVERRRRHRLFVDREGEELIAARDVQHAVRRRSRTVHGASQVHLGEDLLFTAGREHDDVTILVAEIDFPIDDHR